jgi:hypothetical protein
MQSPIFKLWADMRLISHQCLVLDKSMSKKADRAQLIFAGAILPGFRAPIRRLLLATLAFAAFTLPNSVSAQNHPATNTSRLESSKIAQSMQPVSTPILDEPATTDEPATVPVVSKPPQVTYEGGQLTIAAENATLPEIMAAIRTRTGAEVEIPASAGADRFWINLGPGPARKVLASLLSESKFDYLILASDSDPNGIRSVSLTPRTEASAAGSNGGSTVGRGPRDTNRRSRPASSAPPEARPEDQPPSDPAPPAAVAAAPETPQTPLAVDSAAAARDTQAATDSNRPAAAVPDQMMHLLQNMYEERKLQMQQLQKTQSPN